MVEGLGVVAGLGMATTESAEETLGRGGVGEPPHRQSSSKPSVFVRPSCERRAFVGGGGEEVVSLWKFARLQGRRADMDARAISGQHSSGRAGDELPGAEGDMSLGHSVASSRLAADRRRIALPTPVLLRL